MKKKIIILTFFILTLINTIVAVFWMSDIERKTELLVQKREDTQKFEGVLYDSSSLVAAISRLEEEIADKNALYGIVNGKYNPLKMTEGVLLLLEKNRIKIINYRLEGEDSKEELALTAEGEIGSILKLIFDLSFSQNQFRINYITVDAKLSGKPATLIIRITYA